MKYLVKTILSFLIALLFYTTIYSQDFKKCGTFSSENLSKIGQFCNRPTFIPPSAVVQIIETNNFNIHFITDDILPNNPNLPPNDKTTYAYAAKVATAAQAAWNFQVNLYN